MELNPKEFGLFIDGLRIDRKMSREDLCEGIISLSQYKRYLKGTTSIPNDKLVLIADRLKFSISQIHSLYNTRYNKQYSNISDLYYLIKMNDYNKAYGLAKKITKDVILSEYNNLFFDYCMLKIQHALNMVTDFQVLDLYSKLINYPECQNNDSFNWVEINVLIEIVRISTKNNIYEPMDIMYQILSSDRFNSTSTGGQFYLSVIYSTLATILGGQEKYEEAVKISSIGITECLKYEVSNALSQLFLINSYAHFDLGNIEKAKESARKAFMQLYIENKPDKLERYKQTFEKKFEMSLDELIQL